jgi:hypothetical protein
MRNSWFGRLLVTAVVASVAAAGYGYAGVGARGTRALAALETEHCPFAALRAAFTAAPAPSADRAAKTEAAFVTAFDDSWQRAAAGAPHAAAGQDCPAGECPWGTANAGFFASMASADITRQVTRTADGVLIRISSKNPERVRMIHARFEPLFAQDAPIAAPRQASTEALARK